MYLLIGGLEPELRRECAAELKSAYLAALHAAVASGEAVATLGMPVTRRAPRAPGLGR